MRMTAHKLGHELLRCSALLHSDGLLRHGSRFQGLGSSFLALRGHRHAGLHSYFRVVQTLRSSAGYHSKTIRFCSQSNWKGLNASVVQSDSSQNPGNAPDLPSMPQGNINSILATRAENMALFSTRLKECHSPSDVLDLIGQFNLTLRNVSNSLTHIWQTTKKMSEEQRRYERQLMFDHPMFEQLCAYAMHSALRMRSEDLAFSLLAVVKLGVPQRNRLVQTLLRAVQEKLSECDEKTLSVLASCLGIMNSCRNVDALRKGLRLVVEERVSGIQGVVALQNLMRCVGRDTPLPLKRKLEGKALSMVDQFSLPNAQYMVITLAAMNFSSKPLLDICCKKIAENIHTVPSTRLMNILKACKNLHYRDMHLLSAVAEYLTTTFDMWNYKQLVFFMLIFEDLRFRPVALLDSYVERVILNSNSLTLKDVLSLLKICSELNHVPEAHKQEFLERMTSLLESYLPKMSSADLLRGVYSLCILGYFPRAPFEGLLRKETLEELTKDGQYLLSNQRKLRHVDLCLQLDHPFPDALSVPPGIIDPPCTSRTVTRDWGKLIQRIAGDAVIEEGIFIEKTYFIDCLVTLPLQRTDIHLPPKGECLFPEPAQRVAVLFAPPPFFCLGSSHPRGRLVMMLRHLRALGYTPVLVAEQAFDLLSEEEQLETLKHLILPVKNQATL